MRLCRAANRGAEDETDTEGGGHLGDRIVKTAAQRVEA